MIYSFIIQMYHNNRSEPFELDDLTLSQSQLQEYLKEMPSIDANAQQAFDTGLQPLIERALTLDYNISLQQEQLTFYKAVIAEKDSELRKIREKQTKKQHKISLLNDNISKVEKKIKESKAGLQKIQSQKDEIKQQENGLRDQRLTVQQRKNEHYQRALELQEKLRAINSEIDEYDEEQTRAAQLQQQNEELERQIEEIAQRRQELTSRQGEKRRDELKAEVRKWYDKIKLIEKEGEQIEQEFQSNRKAIQQLHIRKNEHQQQTHQLNNIYARVDRIREEVKLREWERNEQSKEYQALLREESELKRELQTEMEYRESQRRIKQNLNHQFRVIESEGDEELREDNRERREEKFDELVSRFEQIRSKSKERL